MVDLDEDVLADKGRVEHEVSSDLCLLGRAIQAAVHADHAHLAIVVCIEASVEGSILVHVRPRKLVLPVGKWSGDGQLSVVVDGESVHLVVHLECGADFLVGRPAYFHVAVKLTSIIFMLSTDGDGLESIEGAGEAGGPFRLSSMEGKR